MRLCYSVQKIENLGVLVIENKHQENISFIRGLIYSKVQTIFPDLI